VLRPACHLRDLVLRPRHHKIPALNQTVESNAEYMQNTRRRARSIEPSETFWYLSLYSSMVHCRVLQGQNESIQNEKQHNTDLAQAFESTEANVDRRRICWRRRVIIFCGGRSIGFHVCRQHAALLHLRPRSGCQAILRVAFINFNGTQVTKYTSIQTGLSKQADDVAHMRELSQNHATGHLRVGIGGKVHRLSAACECQCLHDRRHHDLHTRDATRSGWLEIIQIQSFPSADTVLDPCPEVQGVYGQFEGPFLFNFIRIWNCYFKFDQSRFV
jgi:hypothetical protein